MHWLTHPLRLIRSRYAWSYLVMNLLFYGAIALGMLAVLHWPEIQALLTQSVQGGLRTPKWAPVVHAYTGGHVLRAALITFAVNFLLGTAIEISLPSLFLPFVGIAFGVFRGVLWGLIFGPGANGYFHLLSTHWPVMLLEGQGYILGMLSVYIHGKAIVKPSSVGAAGFWQGYRRGFIDVDLSPHRAGAGGLGGL